MTPKEDALSLWWEFYHRIEHTLSDEYSVHENFITKQCALIAVGEIIKYHESLYNKGFKDVHIALSSPIKTYNNILNPSLEYLLEVKKEIEKL
jgi:hypothetical protein